MRTSHIITAYLLQILKKCFTSKNAKKRFYIASRLGSIFYNYLSIRKKQARTNIKKAFPHLYQRVNRHSTSLQSVRRQYWLPFFDS